MKYFVIILMAVCSASCADQPDEHNSVFLQGFKYKSELLRHGYTTPKVEGLRDTTLFNERARKLYLESQKASVTNRLAKQIGDTNVCYLIRDGKAIAVSIYIPIKHVDSIKLFALLDTLG